MKARRIVSLALALVLCICVTACNQSTPQGSTEAPATTKAAEPVTEGDKSGGTPSGETYDYNINLATGGTAGAYYIMGAGFAQLAEKYNPRLKFTVSNTAASTENTYLLEDGTVNFAVVQSDTPYFATLGEREFAEDEPYDGLRAVYGGHSSITHLLVRKDSGITSVEQLRGKVIAISPTGSPTVYFHRAYLAEFGLEEGSYTERFLSYGEMGTAIVDGSCDAVMIFNTTPNSPVIEAATSCELRLLGLTKEQQESICKKYPYITPCTIPASAYDWLDEDTYSIGALAIIVCRADVPDDVVYDLCALIGDHPDDVKAIHSSGYLWDLEDANIGLNIEIHPGAVKYYKDRGIIQ